MRVVFVGATQLSTMTARLLVDRGDEVVIIERDRATIDERSEGLDCAFLQGDGSKPHILKEVAPEQVDVLFCLTDNDETNILACLIGRSLGCRRVVPRIEEPELSGLCQELGLDDTIIPDHTIARYLVDVATGEDVLELSTHIRGDARFFSFIAGGDDSGSLSALDLPARARLVCLYRDGEFQLANEETVIQAGDELVVLTHSEELLALKERWPGAGAR